MKNALQILPGKQTMSSIEIAKLTGKEHPKVTADIRRILDEAGIDASGFTLTQKYGNNNERIVFNLPYRETQLVISGEVLVRQFCKSNDMIDIGQNKFFDWMKEQNFIMPNREPYQKYVNLGYFRWKPSLEEFGGKIRHQLMITPRGKIFLAAKYMSYLDKDLAA